MAEITLEESWRQIRVPTDRAEQATADRQPDEAVDRWRAVLAHPCPHHRVAAYELPDETHRAYREAGYRSVPDPAADIAECLPDDGELEEADALFATLRERDHEDVWLYNSAAYSYAGIDVAASLRWALDGIEVALAAGDPDQVVVQLLALAEDAWGEMAGPVDQQLVERVERFCGEWTPVPLRPWGEVPPSQDRPCAGCSVHAATLLAEGDAVVCPPGWNEPGWYGSLREIKRCCGPVPAAAHGAS